MFEKIADKTEYKAAQRGFTVLELLMVLVVASVLMGIAVPSFQSWLPTLRLSNAARQVATDLQLARMRAISSNTDTTVAFSTGTGTYSFGGESRSLPQLFPGITISSASNPTFTARGTANAVTITLTNGSSQKLVCVKAVGRVNVRDASC
ncbi:MAG TPA: GspH/FimT family pseudopilin [Candidatus Acidoferrales bacterium]|nr:GspH/FimT family pseudopilin [Candidatus Acidoferrales bacterium]